MAVLEVMTRRHARDIGRALSAPSREEIRASGNWTDGERYMRALLNRSGDAMVLCTNHGLPLAACGTLPVDGNWVSPWVVTTIRAAEFPILLLRTARFMLESWRVNYPNMVFYVHGTDTRGLKLAAALGLRPGIAEKHGHGLFCKVVVETRKIEVA